MGIFVKNKKITRFLIVLFLFAIISKPDLAFAAKERQNKNIEEEEKYINWKKPLKPLARMARNKLTRKNILKFLITLILIVII